MNSTERREARYQRRKAKRQKKQCTFDEIVTIDNIVKAHFQTRKGVMWKASVVAFDRQFLRKCTLLYCQLQNEEWITLGYNVFYLNQRGKLREINSVHYAERVVRRLICKKVFYPILEPKLIYDNGASRTGKGLGHSVKRMKQFLHEFYRSDNSNEGYVLSIDIHDFFGSIKSEAVLQELSKVIVDERLFRLTTILLGASEHILLGPEDSQIISMYFTSRIDHMIQDKYGVRWYDRYMDDSCLLSKDKIFLKLIFTEIKNAYASIGLYLNERKTYITKVSKGFTFCKTRYFLTDTGKVVLKPTHAASKHTRDKLRALKRLVDKGEIDATVAKVSYMSMRGAYLYRHAWHTVRNLDIMFVRLFNIPIKKGDSKMRRGTTATHVFRTSEDLTRATIFVTYKQGGLTVLEKTNPDLTVSPHRVTLRLSQEDTLTFKAGQSVSVQMRYVKEGGFAEASNVVVLSVADILKEGEIYYSPVPEMPVEPEPAVGILLDGNIEDWAKIRRIARDAGVFNQIAAFRTADYMYLMYELNDITKVKADQILFKVNGKVTGGYHNSGIMFLLQNGNLHEYTGDGTNWKWTPVAAKVTRVSNEPYMAEFKISLAAFGTDLTQLAIHIDAIDKDWAIVDSYPVAESATVQVPTFKDVYGVTENVAPPLASASMPIEPDPYKNIVLNGRVVDWTKLRNIISNYDRFGPIKAFCTETDLYYKFDVADNSNVTADYALVKVNGAAVLGYKNCGFTHMIRSDKVYKYAGTGDDWSWTEVGPTVSSSASEEYVKVAFTSFETEVTQLELSIVLINETQVRHDTVVDEPVEGSDQTTQKVVTTYTIETTVIATYPATATQAFNVPTLDVAYMAD